MLKAANFGYGKFISCSLTENSGQKLLPKNADRIFMLVKNHVLAVSGMGDEAPPTPGGRNGESDVL